MDGANGKVYIRANGKWIVSPLEPKDILEQQKEKREHGKATWRRLDIDPCGETTLPAEGAGPR
jgi:hypothetical protein